LGKKSSENGTGEAVENIMRKKKKLEGFNGKIIREGSAWETWA
jgi:hypothetical protein